MVRSNGGFRESLSNLMDGAQESPMASTADDQLRVGDRDGSIGKQITFLETADASEGLCQPLGRDVAVGNGLVDSLNRGHDPVPILADQRHVAACLDSQNRCVSDTVVIDDRMHLEVVSQDDAVVIQFLAKKFPDDGRRQCPRPVFI